MSLVPALRGAVSRARSTGSEWLFDRRYGVRTAGHIEAAALGIDGACHGYMAAGWTTLRRILPPSSVNGSDVFLDVGSGMGRVVLQAAGYPLRRVIGLEISPELHEIARQNVARSRRRRRCNQIELVNADARDFTVPDDCTIVFLFNPFTADALQQVVLRLLESLERNRRRIRIVYVNPVHARVLLQTGHFQLSRAARGWRPGREWSRSRAIHLYDTQFPSAAWS